MSERWNFREGWGTLLLSLGMVIVISLAVAGTGWTGGLNVIPIASLGAFVIGFMIAKSLLPGWIGHLFSLTIGFAWSFRLVTGLFPNNYTWTDRWAWLWWFIYQWGYKLVTGGVSGNNLVFVLQMAFVVWGITYLAVWFIFRARKIWHAIVPGGVLLLINLFYAPKDLTLYFAAYLVLALLLVIRFNVFVQGQTWRRERVQFNAYEIGFDFLRAGTIFTLLIVTLAWITPAVVVAEEAEVFEALRGPWHDLQAEWNRLFTSLNYRPTAGVDFYGRALALGGPRNVAETPVLEVRSPPNARYWRAVVFDKFTGRGWENTNNDLAPFGADNETLPIVTYQARRAITHTVTALGPGMSSLVMAAQPIWVSRPARANLSYVNIASGGPSGALGETPGEPQVETISFARSRTPLDPGDRYIVTSLLTQASIRQLQGAGINYPAWVTDRYLQLPDTVPDRVKQLAEEIAAPYDTPYDKATAIESFLRQEITYNEQINAPPPDRDPVDYILFDLKQAYCDYYATSMVVMLRSLGIPSRITSGYAQGHYNQETYAYTVLQQDAHTWVEVFFPNYGWIEFEPTAAQPIIVRPVDPPENDSAQSDDDASTEPDPLDDQLDKIRGEDMPPESGTGSVPLWARLNLNKPAPWIWGGLTLLTIAMATVWLVRSRRSIQMDQVESVYTSMLRLAGWAGARTRLSQTPYEHASALGQVVPHGEGPARHIAGLYARGRYGHKPADDREQDTANDAWRILHPLLARAILRRWMGRAGR